jgi:hypothetical protein
MNLHNAWEGVLTAGCAPFTHERWLRDIQHWRSERHIRTAYDPTRYTSPRFNGPNPASCSRR